MKLLHLANHGSRNVGNGALILGLERVLREDLDAVEFEAEPWEEYSVGRRSFDESFVERVNGGADALLVGAAVTFDGRPQYGATGMRFDLPLELWPRIRKPVVFYGLSHRDWRTASNYAHLDRLRATLEHAVSAPNVLFGVRNDGTKEWLATLTGVASERILEVPDPAVFVPVEDSPHAELDHGKTNVVLALNDELATTLKEDEEAASALVPASVRDRPRWRRRLSELLHRPAAWQIAEHALHRELAWALRALAVERPLNVVVCAHDPADVRPGADFIRHFSLAERDMFVFAPSGLPVARAPLFYDLYAKCDAAVALRVHAMTPAIGIGAPVVPVLSQRRMRVFMADAGLEHRCVDVRDPAFADTVLARLRAALAERDAVLRDLEAARISLRERTSAFNRLVEEFVTA